MRLTFTVLSVLLCLVSGSAFATEAGWALLRNGGQIVLLRHPNAPGAGDPAQFDITKCNTQRNLSDRGRQQAREIGALFAARAAPVEDVRASRYCRTLETARLAFGASAVTEAPELDLQADDAARAEAQTRILDDVRTYSGSGNLVLVTHGEVIAALTGTRPREAEAVIVRLDNDRLRVIGRIIFN